jgi:hypothetical protein
MPDPFFKQAGWVIERFHLNILWESESHRAGIYWTRQHPHRIWKCRNDLIRPVDAIPIAADRPEAIVH